MPPARRLVGRGSSRRGFLKVGFSGLLGLGLADFLRAESHLPKHRARAKSMIFIWLDGGPATIDMWDPKPDAPSEVRGEFRSIATSVPGVQFGEQMRKTAGVLDHCTVVRSLHHNAPDHDPGSQYLMTGNKPNASLEFPSVGSVLASLLPPSVGMPPYFCLGDAAYSGAGFLGAQHDPFRMAVGRRPDPTAMHGVVLPDSMSAERFKQRQRLREVFDAGFVRSHHEADIVSTLSDFQQQAYDILASDRIGKAFDLQQEPEAVRQDYGESNVGRSTLVARRLIEAGARFVTVSTTGWDTHTENFSALRGLLPPLDQALAALIVDLRQRGMLDETLVVCGGEFGRTPHVNRSAGRDHWARAMSYLLAGGGLKSGVVHGSTDAHGLDPVSDACSPDDLAATLLSQFGFPPEYTLHTTSGRPVRLFEHGQVIDGIVA
ncbi:DUF1501 domain-containing protein [Aeoliella sp.]|uniref:DUF1501 domain-containing protein n=1 Tax=Aeoliella sp. TaxID=2795800 RepID=UPI003CCB9B16